MMGMSHMLMVFMRILSKMTCWCWSTRVRVLIESGVITEGPVDRALCGKMYNRGVRMYEVIAKKVIGPFQTTLEADVENGH